ncbi:calnexin-like [Hippoglossus hippoglossus]|uniref:calnexin-like n=1 Tax=Hippoglossus hippoglossus TaxID=8267 RepID=UPI00148D6220|nr:calnexin-like [Hippoglossus hippoglossus]XP_034453378.1 calnexin-like [Hippoglossus hippoglossus]XP_034453379.1 calnexin-like [Hippoglossus hippoglossus]XP_035017928.1 calnexin [Hippoglossus stenolepis]
MEISIVLLCVTLAASVTPASSAAEPGIIESLLLATNQRPWLWGVYVFTVGLPIILFISLMWPDMRFGPPDQEYYYKKCDDAQPDDPDTSQWTEPLQTKAGETVTRRRETQGNQKKSDLES